MVFLLMLGDGSQNRMGVANLNQRVSLVQQRKLRGSKSRRIL